MADGTTTQAQSSTLAAPVMGGNLASLGRCRSGPKGMLARRSQRHPKGVCERSTGL